jgi:glutamate-1-semialdehyde 2,1-aminomutase
MTASGSTSRAVQARARAVLPGGITRSTLYVPPHPPYAAHAKGYVVTDADGHQVIDVNNNYTSLVHGHGHPRVVAAATDAIAHGASVGLPTEAEVMMAEQLRARTGIEQWRFCNSGSEAVMMALRCARCATARDKVIRFADSYHGTYDDVVASPAGVRKSVLESVIVLPQGDVASFEHAMHEHGHEVAAVLIDLMPSRAGLVPAAAEFVEMVRARTQQAGALMIVDEVITFRLGYGGLAARYGVVPDIVALGKIIGGGFAVGAIGGRADVLEVFHPTREQGISWGGTFSANPVSMRAGLAALSMFDQAAIDRLNAAGDALRRLLERTGVHVNGSGSLLRLILREPSEDWWRLYRRGLLVGTHGLMALSTPMTDDVISLIAERVHAALATDAAPA